MKKFRQHFKIAPLGWLYTDKHQFCQSSQQSKLAEYIQNARDNQGTENSMELFTGKTLVLQTLKQITTNNYVGNRLLKYS